jgi:beta-carotene hydroxylase
MQNTPDRLRALLRNVPTAWPTLVLAGVAISLWLAAMAAASLELVPLWCAGALAAVCAFVAFTPMHDSAHRSLSRYRLLNDTIGRASSVLLAAPYAAFRHVHLEHHKHTNDPAHDPDHYAGRGPRLLLPLRWLTQDLHYYVFVLRCWSQRPRAERVEIVLSVALLLAAAAGLAAAGLGDTVLWVWLVPARVAIGFLAFAFDYLPHVPHRITAGEDRYRATRVIVGPGLTTLMLFQNYHLIHHLYPGVPFYRYRRVFDAVRHELVARGATIDVVGRAA